MKDKTMIIEAINQSDYTDWPVESTQMVLHENFNFETDWDTFDDEKEELSFSELESLFANNDTTLKNTSVGNNDSQSTASHSKYIRKYGKINSISKKV